MIPVLYCLIACIAISDPLRGKTFQMNSAEMKLFNLVKKDGDQQRDELSLDPILCKVARARAADMVKRNYFAHVNPDGNGANYLIGRAGYVLPSYYDHSAPANNIESIGLSSGTPAGMLAVWKKSEFHRPHLMGEIAFYKAQTRVGVGICTSTKAPYNKYFVFISAPPNASLHPPQWILKSPSGKVITTTGTTASALPQHFHQLFGIR
ncbi:MAG: CAP domain-containing protein [Luteolibacter sp.]